MNPDQNEKNPLSPELENAIRKFISAETDLENEARIDAELRAAADKEAEYRRRSLEIVINDKRIIR